MKTIGVENKLKKLQDRKSVITAKIQKLEASTKTIARKQDLQRKILVGTYYLEQAMKNGNIQELQNIMVSFLQRERDKKLFKQIE